MSDPARCSSCGLPLDPPGPGGLCPACLLKMGLADTAATTAPSGAGDATYLPSGAALAPAAGRAADTASVPSVIGPYHLLQPLGEGGMGLVYLAEQREPIHRRVALKLIKPGMDTREVLARFEAERQALALMDHPHIARVIDAGLGPGNRPYFVMEYVAGVPITDYCDRHRLSNAERLQLFLPVCAALQHAHQKGVIHRDLKPSNILVAVQDGKPVPKVIDFGIAKATHQGSAERAAFTQLGMLIGTPEYMSPEQAEASGLEVDTTTDIYSLGVILYELLTGVLPFDAETLRRAGYFEMHRIIREQDPPRPSTRVTALGATTEEVAKRRQTIAGALGKVLRGDLDAIAMKAMEKDRTRRYASASEFAADITRYLNGEAVVARPASVMYRTKKFVRRHRVGVAAAALVFAALVVGLAMSTAFFLRAEAAKRQAEHEHALAAEQSYLANLTAVDLLLRSNQPVEARKRLMAAPASLRGWEWNYLYATADASLATIGSQAGPVNEVAYTPDGSQLLVLSNTGILQAIDPMTELPVASSRYPAARASEPESIIAFAPDGSKYVSIAWRLPAGPGRGLEGGKVVFTAQGAVSWSSESRSILTVKDATTGSIVRRLTVPYAGESLPVDLRMAPGSTRFYAFGLGRVFDMATGRSIVTMGGRYGAPVGVVFSLDGRRLAAWGWDNVLHVWDLTTGISLGTLAGHRDGISEAMFSRDGASLVSASHDGTLRIWKVGGGVPRVLAGHDGGVRAVAISQDGRWIASGGSDKTVRLWDVTAGQLVATCYGHDAEINAVAFSPDGRTVASASRDRTIRLWDTATRGGAVTKLLGHGDEVRSVAFSPDGRQIASGSSDNTVRLWSTDRFRSLVPAGGETDGNESASVSANLERVAVRTLEGRLRVWTLAAQGDVTTVNAPLESGELNGGIVLSADGQRVLFAAKDHTVYVANVGQSGLMALKGHGGAITALAFSPDGTRAASASSMSICVWDLHSARAVHTLYQFGHITGLAFGPDGRWLAATVNRTVIVWDVEAQRSRFRAEGHAADVTAVAFSRDGSRLASGSSDGAIRLWDASTGAPLGALPGSDATIHSIAFDPAGARVAATAGNAVGIWDAKTSQLLLAVQPGPPSLDLVAFSADGKCLLTTSGSLAMRLDSRSSYEPEAEAIVAESFSRLHLAADVLNALRTDASLDRKVRDAALEMAERRGDDPRALNRESWRIVTTLGESPQAYARAFAYAQAATRLLPLDAGYAHTLAVARCRVGQHQECLAALASDERLVSLPFVVMAHYRLGHVEAAREALGRLQAEMAKLENRDNEEVRVLQREAEVLVGKGR